MPAYRNYGDGNYGDGTFGGYPPYVVEGNAVSELDHAHHGSSSAPEPPVPVVTNATVGEWTIWALDDTRDRTGRVTVFDAFQAKLIYNDVHSWALTVPYESAAVVDLIVPGGGILLMHKGVTVLHGPMLGFVRSWARGDDQITFHGVSNECWLAWRRAHPQPATASPPYNLQAADAQTDNVEDLITYYVRSNIGEDALARRQITNWSTMPSLARGPTRTAAARWQSVLELLQPLAEEAGLQMVVERDVQRLIFKCVEPTDVSGFVRFSRAMGTLESYDFSQGAPLADYLYLGGSGEDEARLIVEAYDSTARDKWTGFYIENFLDVTDARGGDGVTEAAAMAEKGVQLLIENGESIEVNLTPTGVGHPQFHEDWNLGDTVGVIVDGVTVSEQIRVVDLKIDKDGVEAIPDVSNPGQGNSLDHHNDWVYAQINALRARTTKLEHA